MKKIFIILSLAIFLVQISGITLEEAVKISLEENVDYKEAKINKKISGINKNNSLFGMVPNLSATVNYDFIDESYKKNFRLSQDIFYSGQEIFSYLSSKYNYEYAKNYLRNKKNEVIIDSIKKYLELLKAQDRVELWKIEVQKAKKDYEKAEKMYEYGNTAKLDLLESKNYYMYAKHNLKVEKNNYNLKKIEYEEYLDKKIDKIEKYEFPELEIKNLKNYMNFAKSNSYEYENLVLNYKANKYNYWSNKLEKLPQVNVFLEKNYTDEEFNSYENDAITYGISVDLSGWLYSSVEADYSYSEYDNSINNLPEASKDEVYSLTMNLLNGDYTTSSVLQEKISYLRSKKRIENEKRALEKLIKTAYYNLVDAKSYYEMQEMNLKAKKELRRKRIKEYELGVIDSSERVDAIKKYLQAEIDYINAKYNYYISWYNLLKVVGKEINI